MKDWTLYVRDNRDLRSRWATLLFCDFMVKQAQAQGMNTGKTQKYILDLKQAIREYNHRKPDRRIITGDYDSVLELVDVPQGVTDIDAWFDENERRVCVPSQYDCTGQAFTSWYKVCKRGDGYKVYHKINFDV